MSRIIHLLHSRKGSSSQTNQPNSGVHPYTLRRTRLSSTLRTLPLESNNGESSSHMNVPQNNLLSIHESILQGMIESETERNSSRASLSQQDHGVSEQASKVSSPQVPGPSSLKVAIDFGTTYTSVAWIDPNRFSQFDDVPTIDRFPDDPLPAQTGRQVPSLSCYPPRPGRGKRRRVDEEELTSLSSMGKQALILEDLQIHVDEDMVNYNNVICHGYQHGYQVSTQPIPNRGHNRNNTHDGLLSRMKLLLDESDVTQVYRRKVKAAVARLKNSKIIRRDEDVIRDYLTVTFLHTRKVLEDRTGYGRGCEVEVIFTVPTCWGQKAISTMTKCVYDAVIKSRLGVSEEHPQPNLFMVNEAEAAATYALRNRGTPLAKGERFILLDCGGGTVDVGTYATSFEAPLRLAVEIVNPASALIGSSFLNERMRNFMLGIDGLGPEGYLEAGGETIEHIVERKIMPKFEEKLKRVFDMSRHWKHTFHIKGLRESSTNYRIKNDQFTITSVDMTWIFEPCLSGIAELMEKQIHGAIQCEKPVDKVVLVGGFADSPALRRYLRIRLGKHNEHHNVQIEFIIAEHNTCATGVAKGAILRALSKEHGPERRPRVSYGVVRHVPYQPEAVKDYPQLAPILEGKRTYSPEEGDFVVINTLQWVIKANGPLIASQHTTSFVSRHVFGVNHRWVVEEALYSSETCTEDYYQLTHPKNKGKVTKVGHITLDLRYLKPHISAIGGGEQGGRKHFVVEVLVDLIVIDRDLKFTVRWPANKDGNAIPGSQKSFSLVAGFHPGTA